MRVDSWCFCNGRGKTERLKASIFSTKSAAMAKLSVSSSSSNSGSSADAGGEASGTGFLIHRNLLLTTYINLPSINAAESAEIRLQNGVPATLVPHRFFITSSVLDLTIVGFDTIEGDSASPGHQPLLPQYLKLCYKPHLELGNIVYLLGHAEKKELSIGEGKVVIATDNLIKLSTEGFTWSPGSAGFDSQGNLAFIICDPLKLTTSPATKSCSTSSSSSVSWKKDLHHPTQFGIPLPVIFDWLNQHWEGSLDDVSKPKLPLMRSMSAGHRSEHSCASFSMRQVFKATEEIEGPTSPSSTVSKSREQPRLVMVEDEKVISQPHHAQGIPTPEIYESPKVTASPVKKETTPIPLLDINFTPRLSRPENCVNEAAAESPLNEERSRLTSSSDEQENRETNISDANEETCTTCSVEDGQSEVCSSEHSSSEAETLYSAETAESRNYTSPREGRFQPVGRSQSCVSFNRRGPVHKNPTAWKSSSLEKQRSFMHPRKTCSQGVPSHKTIDYFSPTVSSIMKKRNNMKQPKRPRPTAAVHIPPRWNF